jgi:hypothetical protein
MANRLLTTVEAVRSPKLLLLATTLLPLSCGGFSRNRGNPAPWSITVLHSCP